MKTYHIAEALFELLEPFRDDEGQLISQYYRAYWISAGSPHEAADILRDEGAADLAALLDTGVIEERTASEVPLEFKGTRSRQSAILWRSGRIFFPPD